MLTLHQIEAIQISILPIVLIKTLGWKDSFNKILVVQDQALVQEKSQEKVQG